MLDAHALDVLFREAHSTHAFTEPVTDEQLRELYELMKWGPTAFNTQPGRFVFVRSKEAKEKLAPALSAANLEKTLQAPVTAIVAYDLHFYEKLPRTFPHRPEANKAFIGEDKKSHAERTAFRNGTLQGAYLILAARAVGLDAGPMSGFDNYKVDEAFLSGTDWRSNFLVNLGYGDPAGLFPRSPRLTFDEACRLE